MKSDRAAANLLVLSAVLVASSIYVLIPIYSPIGLFFGTSAKEIVVASSSFTFFYGIGLLTFGPLSDRFGRKKWMVGGQFLAAALTLLIAYSTSVDMLIVNRALQGFALGSFAPVAFSFSFELFKPKMRTIVLVLINSGFLASGIIGQMLSSFFTNLYSWHASFLFFSICYLIIALLSLFIYPPSSETYIQKDTAILRTYIGFLKDRRLIVCYVITFTLLFSFVAFYEILAGIRSDILLLRATGLMGLILSFFTGPIMDRLKETKTLYLGIGLLLAGLIPLVILPISNWIIILCSILTVGSISLLIPTVITWIGNIAGVHRAKAISLYSFILLVGASFAPIVVAQLNFLESIWILVGFQFINLLGIGILLNKKATLVR